MKKMSISALLLVLAMILGILAGCGNSTGAPAAGSETASAPADAESAADDLFVPDVPVAAAEAFSALAPAWIPCYNPLCAARHGPVAQQDRAVAS